MNFLILRALKLYYYDKDIKAQNLYHNLKEKIINLVKNNYEKNKYF
jgi:hypothetical protein